MSNKPLALYGTLAAGMFAVVICVGMVNGFALPDPFIAVDPLSDKTAGDRFVISGTTSLPAGTELIFEVYPSSFYPQTYDPPSGKLTGEFSGVTGTMTVASGSGVVNTWSFDVDSASLPPQEYSVNISAFSGNPATGKISPDVAYGTARFVLRPVSGKSAGAIPDKDAESPPYLRIDSVAETTTGDLLILSGTTNLPEGTVLMVDAAGWGADAIVRQGSGGVNVWSKPIDTSISRPGSSTIIVTNMEGKPATGEYRMGSVCTTAPLMLKGNFLTTTKPVKPKIMKDDFLRISAIGNRTVGDQFLITGTTSLPIGTEILWKVTPSALNKDPNQTGDFSSSMANSQVTKGDRKTNRVSYALDSWALLPGEYNVTVSTSAGDLSKGDFRPGGLTGSALFVLAPSPASPPIPGTTASPGPAVSPAVIALDPIGDQKSGDTFTITGTTSLQEETNIFWQILPDPGTPPAGIDLNAQVGILANNFVTRGDSGKNRVSLDVDMKDIKPGRYLVLVAYPENGRNIVDPAKAILGGSASFSLS